MGIAHRRLVAALLAGACWLGARQSPAQESETSNEFWPEVDVYVRWNDRFRSYLQISGTHLGDQTYGDGNAGLYLDYYALPILNLPFGQRKADASRGKYVMLRAGYNYTLSNRGTADEPGTDTIVVEATGRVPLPAGVLLSQRGRFDLRWVGADFQPRYRDRVRVERQFEAGKIGIDPYLYGEFFYDFDDGSWNRIIVTGGVETSVSRRVTLEAYYQRQHNIGSNPQFVNGFGLVVQLYLR